MWEKITQLIHGKDCDLRERMFRTIVLVGGAAIIIACTEIFLVMDISTPMLITLLLLVLAMGLSLIVTFKHHNYEFASTLLGVVIIVVVMPLMFCMSGAIESGASVWLALGVLYIFIMFSGKRLCFFMALCFVSYGITFWVSYHYPKLVIAMPSKALAYVDACFSVIVVGIIGGLILKAHMRVFEEEHQTNVLQQLELKESRDTKNAFFANMSHEIRSPINTIIGLNEMILRVNPTGETREYAEDIQVASKMLLSQVNDILDLSQMEMHKMNIIPVQYETVKLFGELVEMIKVRMEKKDLEFMVDFDQNLPSVLYGDEKRLKQIFLNILDNAVKYTEEGSVTLSVQGEECKDGELVLKVKIADTGIGIRKEDMEYLYESFNRADESRNSRIMGSGLGLAITKQLVDMMDGEITVDSIYTKGTIFTVTLRQGVVDEKPVGVVNILRREVSAGESYRPSFEAPEARVLVVDDNRMNTLVASRLLAGTKVQIDVANSGAECLEMTKKKFYHVILMDYMMPGMSGIDTLKALRIQENGLCRDSAVIALTANALSGAREMYREQGFDGYVEKPILGRNLETEIWAMLPSDIIEYQENRYSETEHFNQIQKITKKKRKNIYITADCVCDLPTELLEEYDIKLMYLYIQTPHGRFADTREIDSGSLRQYMYDDNSMAYASSVTVEEYEEFFAEALTEAERVIHISMSSELGKSYHMAVAATKCFDHVHVIDSGQLSCGQGMITLYAALLATEGKNSHEIIDAVEAMKGYVQTGFIVRGANAMGQAGHMKKGLIKFCNTFQLHPYVVMSQKKVKAKRLLGGTIENAWKQGIRLHLRRKRRINRDVVFITHVGCSVKQQEWIKEEVLKHVPFKRVIIQNASFSSACSSGLETIGISFYNF